MVTSVERAELARFLRRRRESITPEQIGLPVGGRRRTPGLRREEVAARASVGVTWYTWMEQARDVQPSAEVLLAVADALNLDRAERSYVLQLGGHPVPADGCQVASSALEKILDALAPNPAVLVNPQMDAVAYNRAFRFLITDLDAKPEDERNCLWLDFVDPVWLKAYARGEDELREVVERTKSVHAHTLSDPMWDPFLARLRARSELFARMWDTCQVRDASAWTKVIINPVVGALNLQVTALSPAELPRLRLLTYLPLDEITRERLTRLEPVEGD